MDRTLDITASEETQGIASVHRKGLGLIFDPAPFPGIRVLNLKATRRFCSNPPPSITNMYVPFDSGLALHSRSDALGIKQSNGSQIGVSLGP